MTSLRLLVVDDHAVVRRGVRALLQSQPGWEICGEATNGEEAVRKAADLKPDIVVLDISLPGLNGLEATSRILKESPESEVLILTMHHSEELAQQVIKAGARGYVLKSDADQSLIAAVDKLRHHQTFFTSRVAEFVLDSGLRGENTRHAVEDPSRRMTSRERQIVQLVAEARSTKEVASQLGISVKTVEAHRTNVMRKLHLHSVSELVRYAIRNRMVSLREHLLEGIPQDIAVTFQCVQHFNAGELSHVVDADRNDWVVPGDELIVVGFVLDQVRLRRLGAHAPQITDDAE